MKHPSHSPSVNSPVNPSGNRVRLWKSIFGRSLPRVCVAGAMVSAVLALLCVVAADSAYPQDGEDSAVPLATPHAAEGARGDTVPAYPPVFQTESAVDRVKKDFPRLRIPVIDGELKLVYEPDPQNKNK